MRFIRILPRLNKHADEIVKAYRDDLVRAQDIADKYDVTRQAIHRLLKRNGVDTSKEQRVERTCPVCGKKVLKTRQRARDARQSFCDQECYSAYMESLGDEYVHSRYHCREARKIVSGYFDLQPEHIVHHEDKNNRNNAKENLRVFQNQSDHLKYHRGTKVKPIWDGRRAF